MDVNLDVSSKFWIEHPIDIFSLYHHFKMVDGTVFVFTLVVICTQQVLLQLC